MPYCDWRDSVHELLALVGGELLQVCQLHELEREGVRGAQSHARRLAGRERLLPTRRAQAPLVAGFQSCESVLRHRGGEVVARRLGESEKVVGHDRAHRVHPAVVAAGFAATVAVPAGERVAAARFERVAVDVRLGGWSAGHDGLLRMRSLRSRSSRQVDADEPADRVGDGDGHDENRHLARHSAQHGTLGLLGDRTADDRGGHDADDDGRDAGRVAAAAQPRNHREQRTDEEAHERHRGHREGLREVRRVEPELFARVHHHGALGVAHHFGGRGRGLLGRHAVRAVDACELGCLGARVALQFAQLEFHLAVHEFVLSLHRNPLAGRHADCAGDRRSDAGQSHDAAADAARGEPDDERHVGDKSVAQAEHRGARRAAGERAVVRVVVVLGARAGVHGLKLVAVGRRQDHVR